MISYHRAFLDKGHRNFQMARMQNLLFVLLMLRDIYGRLIVLCVSFEVATLSVME